MSTGVLFLCLGNICRSPLAEGIFIHRARERGVLDRFRVDSCGTGAWHIGEPPDPRAVAVARDRGIDLPSIARQFDPRQDPARFHIIVAMDRDNVRSAIDAGAPRDRVVLMRQFQEAAEHPDVPDPYHGRRADFERVYDILDDACARLLERLLRDPPPPLTRG